jgi:hypothetical protein
MPSPKWEMRLPTAQRERWEAEAKRRGLSLAELVRQAVENELSERDLPPLVQVHPPPVTTTGGKRSYAPLSKEEQAKGFRGK